MSSLSRLRSDLSDLLNKILTCCRDLGVRARGQAMAWYQVWVREMIDHQPNRSLLPCRYTPVNPSECSWALLVKDLSTCISTCKAGVPFLPSMLVSEKNELERVDFDRHDKRC